MDEFVLTDKRKQFWLIALMAGVSFIITLDYSSLNISLPSIAEYFGIKVGVVAWLPTIYLLIITSSLLGFGKLGDNIGYKTVFLSGMVVYLLGAVVCALSPNFIFLFVARAFQSLGQAMFSPMCIALLTYYLPANMRGRALGLYATLQGLGLALGPAIGGFMISTFNWRGNFAMVVPLSLLVFIFGIKLLPAKQKKAPVARFDYLGAILLFLGLVGFLYALNTGSRAGWTDTVVLSSLVLGVAASTLFIIREKRVAYPLLDLKIFRNSNFTFAALAALCGLAQYIGISFFFPFYLQMMRHIRVAQAGMIMMAPSIMMMLLAPFTGGLADKIGSRKLCVAGMSIAALAFILFSFLGQGSSQVYIVISLIVLGTGMGFFIAPNNRLVMQNSPAEKQGVASGVYKIALNAGSSIGIALYMLVLSYVVLFDVARMNIMLDQVREHPDIMMAGFRGAFIFGIGLALATLAFSFLAKDPKS